MLVTIENLTAENCKKVIEENAPKRLKETTTQLLSLIHFRICQYVNEEGILCDLLINLSAICRSNDLKIPSKKERKYICKELESRGFQVKLSEEFSHEDAEINYNLWIWW